jgi:hypothetical protein
MEAALTPQSDSRRVERPALVRSTRDPEACTAELAECTCPDFCERDHANE